MIMIDFREAGSREEWDDFVDRSNGHGLQIWGWGEVKGKHGWDRERVLFERGGEVIGGTQVLRRKLPMFGAMLYVPRGPVVADEKNRKDVLEGLAKWAGKYRGKAVCLMLEPDWQEFPKLKEWKRSHNRILLAETVVLDLGKGVDKLVSDLSRRRRKEIRKYAESGLKLEEVKTEADFAGALKVYKEIAVRAKFNLHESSYYEDIWREMGAHQQFLVVKNEKGRAIGFQWVLLAGKNAFALFGGVGAEGRERGINEGMKWECLRILEGLGVENYDFNGLLNAGINDYKMKFGGEEVKLCGAWELPLSKLYPIYGKVLPAGKSFAQFIEKFR